MIEDRTSASGNEAENPHCEDVPLELDKMVEKAREASNFLKTLSNETRLVLLCLLSGGERSVTELEQMLSLRQPAVSQQLARLRLEGLVDTRRDGKVIYYSIADDDVRRLIALLHDVFCPTPLGDATVAPNRSVSAINRRHV